ncbi:MAG: metallophosphoesterase [Chloroflexota bacterium]
MIPKTLTFYYHVALVMLLALGTSCTPWVAPAQPAAIPTASAAAPVPATPAPARPPRQTLSPEIFPTSASVPTLDDLSLILGRPTAGSIAVSLLAATDQQIVISYGPAPGSDTAQTEPVFLQARVPQTVELTGLEADTAYSYTIIAHGADSGGHSFHTQRAPGSSFTFTIDADPHNRDPRFNEELYATTLANILADHPDFHVNLGDTFMTEKVKASSYAEAESTFLDMRPYFGIIGAEVPLFLVNGNHEGELGWLLKGRDKDLPLWSAQLRQLYYPNPLPGGFYSGAAAPDPQLGAARDAYFAWTWGDALFIALDPFWYTTSKPQPGDLDNNWNWTLGKEQYDWLKATLEASQARFKFVFIHHLVGGSKDGRGGIEAVPYFEWGGNNADGSYGFDQQRPGWGQPIHQLLVENHVSAVFHGHDHVFVKQDLDGIVYQEIPQPSVTEYNNTRLAADYGYTHGDILGSSGHLRVTVTPAQVIIEYVHAYLPQDEKPGQQNGQVDYAYTVYPR